MNTQVNKSKKKKYAGLIAHSMTYHNVETQFSHFRLSLLANTRQTTAFGLSSFDVIIVVWLRESNYEAVECVSLCAWVVLLNLVMSLTIAGIEGEQRQKC